mgnify:FL=1
MKIPIFSAYLADIKGFYRQGRPARSREDLLSLRLTTVDQTDVPLRDLNDSNARARKIIDEMHVCRERGDADLFWRLSEDLQTQKAESQRLLDEIHSYLDKCDRISNEEERAVFWSAFDWSRAHPVLARLIHALALLVIAGVTWAIWLLVVLGWRSL